MSCVYVVSLMDMRWNQASSSSTLHAQTNIVKTIKARAPLRTEIIASAVEFDVYRVVEPIELAFALKEFKVGYTETV
jgi:hypothetical protein